MKNHWIIYNDFTAQPGELPGTYQNAVGLKSKGFDEAWKDAGGLGEAYPASYLPIEFLILDDDGYLYYSGRMMEADFDPLDDFGRGNAGATDLWYRNPSDLAWRLM